MIDSVAGYGMVDMSGLGRFVTGQIMPVRIGGAKKAKKYEDYLFLMEGLLERRNWMKRHGAPTKERPWMGRMGGFSATAWNRVAKAEMALQQVYMGGEALLNFCDAETQIPTSATSPADWQHAYRDAIARVADRAPQIEEVEFKAGWPKKEDVEKAFRNLKKLTRTWVRFDGNIDADSRHRLNKAGRRIDPESPTVDVFEDYDEPGEWSAGLNPVIYSHSSTGEHVVYPDSPDQDKVWAAEFTENDWHLGTTDWFPYAKSAKAVMVVDVAWDNAGSESDGSSVDALTVDVAVRSGTDGRSVLDFSSIDMDAVAASALSRHGLTMRQGPTNVPWENVRVQLAAIWMIIDNEFPATPT